MVTVVLVTELVDVKQVWPTWQADITQGVPIPPILSILVVVLTLLVLEGVITSEEDWGAITELVHAAKTANNKIINEYFVKCFNLRLSNIQLLS
mgnify:CR=1 FL=1